MLLACISVCPPFSFAIYSSLLLTECMLTWMLTVQREVGVCVEERGRGISFNASALLCDSPSSHIYSVSSLSLFLSFSPFPSSLFCLSCVTFFLSFCISVSLMSDIHAHLTQAYNLCHTGSHIHQSCIIPPLAPLRFPALGFLAAAPPSQLLYSAFTPWLCSLRQKSAADWGGCLKSIIARSEATCLWHLSPSLCLLLTPLSSCLLSLRSVRVGMIVLVCSYREWVPYYLWTAALNIITHYASEVAYLQISLCLSQLIVLLLLLLHWIPSLHTLLYWHLFCSTPLLSSLWMSVRFLCMLCPFEFLPETWPCCRILKEPP